MDEYNRPKAGFCFITYHVSLIASCLWPLPFSIINHVTPDPDPGRKSSMPPPAATPITSPPLVRRLPHDASRATVARKKCRTPLILPHRQSNHRTPCR